jgi:hypothetical protein
LLGIRYRLVLEESVRAVLELMALAVVHEHLGIVNHQHFRELLLLAENGVQNGGHANCAEADYDEGIALLLGVNFP